MDSSFSSRKDFDKDLAMEDLFDIIQKKFKKGISYTKSHDYDCWILSFLYINRESTFESLISYLSFYLDASRDELEIRIRTLETQGLIRARSRNLSLSNEAWKMLATINSNELKEKRSMYEELVRLMNVWGAIFIIGAGFSFDSDVPLEEELMPAVLKSLEVAGVERPKTQYLKSRLNCWKIIRNNPNAFVRFKELFSEMNDQKIPNSTHRELVRLFAEERNGCPRVAHVVCMNWDDLLERAYTMEYGRGARYLRAKHLLITRNGTLSSHAIWKMHGDVADAQSEWVLPYERGIVFNSLLEEISGKPFVVSIIGYSEGDEEIVSKLISKLDKSSVVYKIGPRTPTNYKEKRVNNTATEAMDWIERIYTANFSSLFRRPTGSKDKT